MFGAGVTAADISASRANYNLVLSIAGTSDRIVLDGWFRGSENRIQEFVFADGSTLPPAATFYQNFLTYVGDASGNTLWGNDDNEVIRGLGGNDSLSANGGADILEGGDGQDSLSGDDGPDQLLAAPATTRSRAARATSSMAAPITTS